MSIVELRPHLYRLILGRYQAYLWRDDDAVTLIDTGEAGSGPAIADALRQIGLVPTDIDRLVLTHFHDDHAGSAAEVGSWGAVQVVAHALDAPVIRGEVAGPPPNFSEDERELHARAGYRDVTVITGDGAHGYPPRAPYDRILSTAAVGHVPTAWVTQTRPGGRVITPWGTAYLNGALLSLTVGDDNTATGRLVDNVAFMWLRDQRLPLTWVRDCVYDEDKPGRIGQYTLRMEVLLFCSITAAGLHRSQRPSGGWLSPGPGER